jgi:hypothetical protein
VYDSNSKAIPCSTSANQTSFATIAGGKYKIMTTPLGVTQQANPSSTRVMKIQGENSEIYLNSAFLG